MTQAEKVAVAVANTAFKEPSSKPKRTSKLKAVDPKSAEPSKPKVLIYGKPGVGKTWTSLDFPSVYYIDTEGGANLGHYTDKLKKAGGVYFGPEQGSLSFETVIEQVQALATEDHPYKTLVIDSISKIYGAEIAKEAERLGEKDAFGASKKLATQLTRRLISWIDRIDMNVIIIAHEKALWAKGEQAGTTFDAWDKLGYELHLCLEILKMGSSRKARVVKSRLPSFADGSLFDWSYDEFSKLYGRDVVERTSAKIDLASDEQLSELKHLLEVVKLPDGETEKWLTKANASSFEEMDAEKVGSIITFLKNKINKGE